VTESSLNAPVIAFDYQPGGAELAWPPTGELLEHLVETGVRHVAVFGSLWQPGRQFVTIRIDDRSSARAVLASSLLFDWLDISGVHDLPAVFVGEVVDEIYFQSPVIDTVPGVLVSAVAQVADVTAFIDNLRAVQGELEGAGVRRIRLYRALDDERELMVLQQIETEAATRRWIDSADRLGKWMFATGVGAYPSMFVGALAHAMVVGELR
jgi:hypothetical protein